MPTYGVITDFKIEQFSIIRRSLSLEDIYFVTNDFTIQEQISSLGYKIEHIEDHFGHVNQKIYSIYENAMKNTSYVALQMKSVLFKGMPLIDGMKSFVFVYLIFLEQIKSILEEKKNVIFVFPNTEYHYFAIIDIAEKLEYSTNIGICCVNDSNLSKINFDGTSKSDPRFIYHETSFLYDKSDSNYVQDNFLNFIELKLNRIIVDQSSEYAFFLNDNPYGLYLKPVIPLIKKFEESRVGFTIFTVDSWSYKWLEGKGFRINDLSDHINEITNHVLKLESEVIVNFLNSIQKINVEDITLQALLKYIRNDAIARYLARTIALVYVTDFIFNKFNFKSSIIALDGGSPDMDTITNTAKNHHLQTNSIMIQSYTQHIPYLGFLLNADRIFVGGIRIKKELIELGVQEKRLVVSGNPRYDYISKLKKHKNREKHIVVAISRWDDDDKWLPYLIRFCNEKQFKITIKIHPMYQFVLKKLSDTITQNIKNNCKNMKFDILYEPDISVFLHKADIVIITSPGSTVGLESTLHNIPLITYNANNDQYHKLAFRYHEEGVALYATNIDELFEKILLIINNKKTTNHLRKMRQKFNRELNFDNDFKATQRIFNILQKDDIKERSPKYLKNIFKRE